jgi:hypothetical protein
MKSHLLVKASKLDRLKSEKSEEVLYKRQIVNLGDHRQVNKEQLQKKSNKVNLVEAACKVVQFMKASSK